MTAASSTGSADRRLADVVKAINFVADAGKQMLESSSSVSEVLARLIEVAPAVGLDSCDIDATLSSVTISYWGTDVVVPLTAMRAIHIGQPRLERLAGTGALLDQLQHNQIDLDEAIRQLRALEDQPALRRRYAGLAVLLSVAGWVVFLNGIDAGTMAAALLATLLALPVKNLVDRLGLPAWAGTFAAALIIAAVPNLLAAAGAPVRVGPAVVGSLFIYLPGRALVSSMIDGLSNAPLSALARGLEAVVTAGVLALGMLVGANIGAGLGLSYTPKTETETIVISVLAAAVGVLGLAMAWRMPFGQLLPSAAVGALGWLIVSAAAVQDLGSGWAAYTLAALGVGLAGALLSTAQGTPTSVYTGVAILPLVPGLTLYQGMLAISQGKTAVAFERLFEAVVISVAIAVGVAVGLALGRNGVKLGRRIVGWRP